MPTAIIIMGLPVWFKQEIPDANALATSSLISEFGVHTVCRQAKCPNTSACFKNKTVTFLILGDTCTRDCRFCAVDKSDIKLSPEEDEPYRIGEAVKRLGLNYVVVTSVTRDDLSDGGAAQFAKTVELIHEINKNIKIELLIPDFAGKLSSLQAVLAAGAFVVAHNLETVSRLYPDLRPKANYQLSLHILRKIKEFNSGIISKSSLMLGLGEKETEVIDTICDLRDNHCDILALGQYLAPSAKHYPVKEFISPEQFQRYKKIGLSLGFKTVASGPLVRSSYCAEEYYKEFKKCMI